MKPAIKNDCTHAYVGRVVLAAIFMVLFIAVMHGQVLPNAPQAAVKHQTPPLHKQEPLLAKLGTPILGSADWFREHGLFLSWQGLCPCLPTLTGTLAMTSQRK